MNRVIKENKLSKKILIFSAGLFGCVGVYFSWRSFAATDVPGMTAKPYVKLFSQIGGNGNLDANSLSQYYSHIHGEGSNPSSFQLKNSGLGIQLIEKGVWSSQYRNGSYISQAEPGPSNVNFSEAGDLERDAPLAIGTFWPGDWKANQSDTGAAVLLGSLDPNSSTITFKLSTKNRLALMKLGPI